MLKFESLEIIGFKSFAEKTGVAFDGKVTCIVGPNGCGKSNLSDAIAWVLGAQNARSLRSDKMEDVIFNGTARRKPSGVAEITLTVRRADEKRLFMDGVELTDERLEITRRLYRTGESAYLINQQRCRLKDIHQFLEDADLGLASYALIAQGHIESFLSSKPMDRRSIIEEAAGILGYKSRRKSAELKLELAQQNLLRVNDIVVEVERQLRSLKRQAARARRYRELREELREVQRRKFALEARDLAQRLQAIRDEAEALTAKEESLKEKLQACQQAYRARMETRERLEKRQTEVRQALAAAHLEVDRSGNSIQYHEDQIAHSDEENRSCGKRAGETGPVPPRSPGGTGAFPARETPARDRRTAGGTGDRPAAGAGLEIQQRGSAGGTQTGGPARRLPETGRRNLLSQEFLRADSATTGGCGRPPGEARKGPGRHRCPVVREPAPGSRNSGVSPARNRKSWKCCAPR